MRINTTLFGNINLLTHCPLVGASESFAFVTAINESFNGVENRVPLRDKAKQQMKFNYINFSKDFAEDFADIRRRWAVPFNQELQYIGDASGDIILCDTSLSDFRNDSLALIKSGDQIRVAEIQEVLEDGLQLYYPIDEIENATISPLRLGYFDGDIQRVYRLSHVQNTVTFVVDDPAQYIEKEPEQYKGKDIYFFVFREANANFQSAIRKQQDFIDYEIGNFSTRSRWTHSITERAWKVVIDNKEELFEFKRFLARRLGQFREFWMNSQEQNLIVKNTGLITSNLDVELLNSNWTGRRKFAIHKKDGTWVAVSATGASVVGGNTRFALESPLNIYAQDIERISYLGLYRLATDEAEITYNGNNTATCPLTILEYET